MNKREKEIRASEAIKPYVENGLTKIELCIREISNCGQCVDVQAFEIDTDNRITARLSLTIEQKRAILSKASIWDVD